MLFFVTWPNPLKASDVSNFEWPKAPDGTPLFHGQFSPEQFLACERDTRSRLYEHFKASCLSQGHPWPDPYYETLNGDLPAETYAKAALYPLIRNYPRQ